MTEPARRLPVSAAKRLRNVVDSSPVKTNRGATGWGRRVDPGANGKRSSSAQSVDPAGLPRVALVTGFSDTDYPSMSQPNGRYYLYDLPSGPDWGIDEDSGQGVIVAPDNDGGIYFFEAGVYAVTLILNIEGIQDADPDCTIRLFVDTITPFGSGFSCVTRGGDARVDHSDLTSTCRVYYEAGGGLARGIFPGFMYTNLDMAVVPNIAGLIQVQRLV